MFRWRIEQQAVREPSRNAMRSQIGRDLLLYLENLHLLTERAVAIPWYPRSSVSLHADQTDGVGGFEFVEINTRP